MMNKTDKELVKLLIKTYDLEKKTKDMLKDIEKTKTKIMDELWNRVPKVGGRTK